MLKLEELNRFQTPTTNLRCDQEKFRHRHGVQEVTVDDQPDFDGVRRERHYVGEGTN